MGSLSGRYLGGFPIIGTVCGLMLVPGIQITSQAAALSILIVAFSFLGMLRDIYKTEYKVILPYQILLFIFGAIAGIQIPHSIRLVEVLLSILWPVIIVHCLKLASLVFEMPFILCLESGLTFLLFFVG
ncbi:hypothetical protein HYY75_00865, partial [bacterium]|nr:hypothetical protein [bacterium]